MRYIVRIVKEIEEINERERITLNFPEDIHKYCGRVIDPNGFDGIDFFIIDGSLKWFFRPEWLIPIDGDNIMME